MSRFNTGNPIDSNDPRDLSDNAKNLDQAVNTEGPEWTDRLGVTRRTLPAEVKRATDAADGTEQVLQDAQDALDAAEIDWEDRFVAAQDDKQSRFNAFIASSGYQFAGDYDTGIELTEYNQVVRDENGEFWRVSGSQSLPYTTTGAGLPESGAFVTVGDAALRQELDGSVQDGQGARLVRGAVIYVDTIADLQALDTSGLVGGQSSTISTTGRAGSFAWMPGDRSDKVSRDPQQGIWVAPSSDTSGESGAWMRQFSGFDGVDVRWFGAVGDYQDHSNKGTDDHAAIQAALNTGWNVHCPKGSYRVHEKELLMVTVGQKLSGDGCGSSYFGPTPAVDHEPVTDLVFTGTGQRYTKTRRKYRASSSDPQDDPISTAVHVSNAGVQIEDIAVRLSVDYSDGSPTNLGDEWDVGIFIRCVPQFRAKNVRVFGYWRDSSIRYDGTQASNLPNFTTPDGVELPYRPNGMAYPGFDQSYCENVFVQGGLKGLWLAGPDLPEGGPDYYDEILGDAVNDERGAAGCADFCYSNSTLFSREHHSLQRAKDPVQPLNFDEEDFDSMPAALAIDARGVVDGRTHARRMIFNNTRVRSFEMCSIGVKKGSEIYFNDLHTEPSPGSNVKDTNGNEIDHTDYSDSEGKYYGPIAVQDYPGFDNRVIDINRINFRQPSRTFFFDKVPHRIVKHGGASTSKINMSNFGNENLEITERGSSVNYNSSAAHIFQRDGEDQIQFSNKIISPYPGVEDVTLGSSADPFSEAHIGELYLGENGHFRDLGGSTEIESSSSIVFSRDGERRLQIGPQSLAPYFDVSNMDLGTPLDEFRRLYVEQILTNGNLRIGSNDQSGVIEIISSQANIDRSWNPQTDDERSLGLLAERWSELRAANDTINTSDAREKQDVQGIPDEVLDAWADVEWAEYRWKHRVQKKGEDARIHFGLLAQQVIEAFEKHGLDPFRYSLVCYEEWDEQEEITETVPAEYDEEGNLASPEKQQVTQKYRPAGSRYGIRYNHAQAIEAAYQRREIKRLKEMLDAQ